MNENRTVLSVQFSNNDVIILSVSLSFHFLFPNCIVHNIDRKMGNEINSADAPNNNLVRWKSIEFVQKFSMDFFLLDKNIHNEQDE